MSTNGPRVAPSLPSAPRMIHGVGIMSSTSTFLHLFSSKSLCVVFVLTGHSLCMTIRLRSGLDRRRTQFQNQSSFTNLVDPNNLLMKTSSPNKMPNIHLGAITDGSLMPYLTIKGRQNTCSSRVLNRTYSTVHGRTINVLIISDPMQSGMGSAWS